MSEQRIEDEELGPLVHRAGEWGGRITLPLPLDATECDLRILADEDNPPTEAEREAFRYAVGITPEAQARLAAVLHADYLMTLDAVGPEDMPEVAAPADVWPYVELIEVVVSDHAHLRHRYFVVQFEVEWEREHGAEVLFRDGEPMELDIIGSSGSPEDYDNEDAGADGE